MSSGFVTRIEKEKDEPYTVIFTTDDHDKYRHIEDECRMMIGHSKPTVNAVPVRQGRWKGAGMGDYYCSLCQQLVSDRTNYCPNCGAIMVGGVNDETL